METSIATIEEKLRSLYYLQLVDYKIDEIIRQRGELPMEVSDLEDEQEGLQTRLDNLKQETSKLKKDVDDRKNFIKEANALIRKYEEQQNNVKNNREFVALSKEIEMQRLEIMAAEKKIKEYQYQLEEKKGVVENTKVQLEIVKSDLTSKKTELDKLIDETRKEEDTLNSFKEEAIKPVDERLLSAYNRIRNGTKNGLAIVTIDRDSCAGCFTKIPPQRQLDIRRRLKVIVCENCGRILVDNELASEESTRIEEATK